MNLLALALGLFIERFLTELFHLREARWLDGYFDFALQVIGERKGILGFALAIVAVALPVLPVIAFFVFFRDFLYGVPYFLFAVVVLMFSLGPRDLEKEVDEYVEALRNGETEKAQRVAKELLETEPPHERRKRTLAIEEAIFIQSNNRLFGVVLWFILLGPIGAWAGSLTNPEPAFQVSLLGPIGAWAFRVSNMFRRRAIYEAARATSAAAQRPGYGVAAQRLHGVVAWLPARLLALAFALAGSFETAVSDWRAYYNDCADQFFDVNDDVVACAGVGALGGAAATGADTAPELQGARNAMRLVSRALWVWLTAIAVLTIFGWAV